MERMETKARFAKRLYRYRKKRGGGEREGWERMDEGRSWKIPFFSPFFFSLFSKNVNPIGFL